MENDYAWEQLYGAVSSLATDDSGLRERLLNAVLSRVQRIFPPETLKDKLPPEIHERLIGLETQLTKYGSYQKTVDKMEDYEVKNAIEEIVGLFSMVARAFPES